MEAFKNERIKGLCKEYSKIFIFSFFDSKNCYKWVLFKALGVIKKDHKMFEDIDKNLKNVITPQKQANKIHIPNLDDGEFAFVEWLNSEDKNSSANHMILKRYEKDKESIINDNTLHSDVIITINDGVPFCTYCKDDSCAHVGFTICVMQLFERKGILIGEDESILDLLKD